MYAIHPLIVACLIGVMVASVPAYAQDKPLKPALWRTVADNTASGSSSMLQQQALKGDVSLEVTLEAGKTDVPLDIMMMLQSYTLRNEQEEDALSHHLQQSLFERGDTADFLLQRRPIPLKADGAVQLQGLPPFAEMTLLFSGAIPGIHVTRTVQVPKSGKIAVTLRQEELLGDVKTTASLHGQLHFAGNAENGAGQMPVQQGKVVYSSYPFRQEAAVDAQGKFTIPEAYVNRDGTLFFEAMLPDGEPPFDRLHESVAVNADMFKESAAGKVVRFEMPYIPSLKSKAGTLQNGLWGDPVQYDFPKCPKGYTQSTEYEQGVLATTYKINPDKTIGKVPYFSKYSLYPSRGDNKEYILSFFAEEPGTYLTAFQYTPFLVQPKSVTVSEPKTVIQVATGPTDIHEDVSFVVYRKGGGTSKVPGGVQVTFASLDEAVDPYNALTTDDGLVAVKCFNLQTFTKNGQVPIFVNDPVYGKFDGFLLYKERGPYIQLQ